MLALFPTRLQSFEAEELHINLWFHRVPATCRETPCCSRTTAEKWRQQRNHVMISCTQSFSGQQNTGFCGGVHVFTTELLENVGFFFSYIQKLPQRLQTGEIFGNDIDSLIIWPSFTLMIIFLGGVYIAVEVPKIFEKQKPLPPTH